AARLNASFAWVSPAVNLPTTPDRRVVDAGYFDNDGVDIAAMWLFQNRVAIRECTSGVVLIQIRSTRTDYSRYKFQRKEDDLLHPLGPDDSDDNKAPARPARGLVESAQWLSTPVEAIVTEWERSMYSRNDELLHILGATLNDKAINPKTTPDFFVSVSFE